MTSSLPETTFTDAPAARCNLCGNIVPPTQLAKWIKDGHEIVACTHCGLVFRRVMPAAAAIPEIYEDGYFKRPPNSESAAGYLDYLGDEPAHRSTARRRLNKISDRLPKRARLLDVGCASGVFLAEAEKRGCSVSGVDVSPMMVDAGARRHSLSIELGTFETLELDGEFDCITMWDYLEHTVDPMANLKKAQSLLAPGGILAMSTGDVSSLIARALGSRWHLLTPNHHNFFFGRSQIRKYLDDSGFTRCEIAPWPRYASLHYLVYKTAVMLPKSRTLPQLVRWLGSRSIGEITLPVNTFDVMTAVATTSDRQLNG